MQIKKGDNGSETKWSPWEQIQSVQVSLMIIFFPVQVFRETVNTYISSSFPQLTSKPGRGSTLAEKQFFSIKITLIPKLISTKN